MRVLSKTRQHIHVYWNWLDRMIYVAFEHGQMSSRQNVLLLGYLLGYGETCNKDFASDHTLKKRCKILYILNIFWFSLLNLLNSTKDSISAVNIDMTVILSEKKPYHAIFCEIKNCRLFTYISGITNTTNSVEPQ